MNKEIEESIKDCEEIIKSNNAVIKEARKNEDINVMQLTASLDRESKAIETLLNYIKDSTPNSAIEEKIKELNKQYDEILSKYTEEEIDNGKEEYDDWLKMDRISEKLSILRETLKEGEK